MHYPALLQFQLCPAVPIQRCCDPPLQSRLQNARELQTCSSFPRRIGDAETGPPLTIHPERPGTSTRTERFLRLSPKSVALFGVALQSRYHSRPSLRLAHPPLHSLAPHAIPTRRLLPIGRSHQHCHLPSSRHPWHLIDPSMPTACTSNPTSTTLNLDPLEVSQNSGEGLQTLSGKRAWTRAAQHTKMAATIRASWLLSCLAETTQNSKQL
jgi:hypothetical protein